MYIFLVSSYFHIFWRYVSFLVSSYFHTSSFFVSSWLSNSLAGFFETLVILSAILLPIKSPVASAVFLIALFDVGFIASVVNFLALSRSFWPYLLLKLLSMFLAKDKNPYPFTYILSLGSIESLIFICNLHLITIVKFTLSSISNGWLFWSVKHTLISSYSELNIF